MATVPFEEHEIADQFPWIPPSVHEFPESCEDHTYPSELPTYITGEPSAAAIDDHVPNVPPGWFWRRTETGSPLEITR
jgi:hypothetical protein